MQVHSTAGTLVRDVGLDVVRFPLWWYSVGAARAARFAWGELRAALQRLSLPILFRSLLKPMFGDTTRSGRAISLFMRLVTFIFKVALMAVWVVIVATLFVAWFAAPVGFAALALQALGTL